VQVGEEIGMQKVQGWCGRKARDQRPPRRRGRRPVAGGEAMVLDLDQQLACFLLFFVLALICGGSGL
jgi:hypothetical protein